MIVLDINLDSINPRPMSTLLSTFAPLLQRSRTLPHHLLGSGWVWLSGRDACVTAVLVFGSGTGKRL